MKNKKILDRIAYIIADAKGVEPTYMFQNNRKQDVTDMRSIFHYITVRNTKETLSAIGQYSKTMGREKGHDHASVLHGKRKIESLMQFDKKLSRDVQEIEDRVLWVVNSEAFIARKKQKQINEIIDLVFQEEDETFIDLLYGFIGRAYSNKNTETINIFIDFLNSLDDEGIHQTTQDNSGVGVV